MPNFFIDRPIFCMGDRHYHHAGWGIIDPQIAGGAISDDCAASNFHYRHVPRC